MCGMIQCAVDRAGEPGGTLQLSGPSLVKCSQQVLSICFGPGVTLENLLSPAVASADGGKQMERGKSPKLQQ